MSLPTVCVCLPVRNGESYLPAAVESVLAQEGVDLELRIYDNLSTDRSFEIAEAYAASDPRVLAIRNPFDIHAYGSYNRGLAESECEFYVPFASDDLMLRGNLERKTAALEETGAGLAHSYARLIDGAGRVTGLSASLESLPAHAPAPGFFLRSLPVNPVLCQAVLARREALASIGGFDVRVPYCADWHAWLRLSLRVGVATVHEPLIAYREHTGSGTSAALASGSHAYDTPAAVADAFADQAVPPAWRSLRPRYHAARFELSARDLERSGLTRATGGASAYALAAAALVELPEDHGLAARYRQLAAGANLHPPALPLDVVAVPEPGEVERLVVACERLRAAGVLAGLVVGAEKASVDALVPPLQESLAAAPDLGVDLVAVDRVEELLAPGRVLVTAPGTPLAARAEAAGAAILPLSLPDPFAAPADPERWQTLVPATI